MNDTQTAERVRLITEHLEGLAKAVSYDEYGDGSVDNLIDYKNSLEDEYTQLLSKLWEVGNLASYARTALDDPRGLPDEAIDNYIRDAAAGQLANLGGSLVSSYAIDLLDKIIAASRLPGEPE